MRWRGWSGGSAGWSQAVPAGLATWMAVWPVSAALGIFALSNLGPTWGSSGAAAGLVGAALTALLVPLMGGAGLAVHVPRSVSGVFMASLAAGWLAWGLPAAELPFAAFLMLMMAALFQWMLGALGLASIVQYCPHPVVTGFLHAMALLLASSQLPSALGLGEAGFGSGGLPGDQHTFHPARMLGSVLAASVTLVWMLRPPRWRWFAVLPPAIGAVVAGSLVHHLGSLVGLVGQGAPHAVATAAVPAEWPVFDIAYRALDWALTSADLRVVFDIAATAFALAVLASIDHLLSAKAFEATSGQRVLPDSELKRVGAAALIVSALGCVPCTISLAASQTHVRALGRGWRSAVVLAVLLVFLVPVLVPVWAWVSPAAIAGFLLSVAWRLIDRPMLDVLRSWCRPGAIRARAVAVELATSCVVTAVALAFGMLVGVAVGVLMSVVWFIAATRRSVVRAVRSGGDLASRRVRPPPQRRQLMSTEARTVVVELDGILYFGTSEGLQSVVDGLMLDQVQRPRTVILDVRRLRYVDATGLQAISALRGRIRSSGTRLWLAGASAASPLGQAMGTAGGLHSWTAEDRFDDLDRALEHDEDERLGLVGLRLPEPELDWRALSPLDRLRVEHQDALYPCLRRQVFEPGQVVFRQGDAGDTLYLIARGAAEVFRQSSDDGGERTEDGVHAQSMSSRIRLATFHAGSFFGEMAFLGGARRDASVLAEGEVVAWTLRRRDLDEAAHIAPALAARLYEGLSLEMAERVRQANRMINSLVR